MESWDLVISLDRLLTSLAATERERTAAQGLEFTPPVIRVVDRPAVLVLLDGEPRYGPGDDAQDVRRVINTPYTLVRHADKELYYLDGGTVWYAAAELDGPWTQVKKPPKKVRTSRRSAEARASRCDTVGR